MQAILLSHEEAARRARQLYESSLRQTGGSRREYRQDGHHQY